MIYNNIEEIYQSLNSTREKLLKTSEGLSAEKGSLRENAEGWSVAEILEHLGIVEAGIINIIEKLLEKAEIEGKPFDGNFDPPLSLENMVKLGKGQKFNAPDFTHPQNSRSIEESLSVLLKNRVELKSLQKRIEGVDAGSQKFPHPAFGKINLYEWLAVINFHEFRHLQQIERILK